MNALALSLVAALLVGHSQGGQCTRFLCNVACVSTRRLVHTELTADGFATSRRLMSWLTSAAVIAHASMCACTGLTMHFTCRPHLLFCACDCLYETRLRFLSFLVCCEQ